MLARGERFAIELCAVAATAGVAVASASMRMPVVIAKARVRYGQGGRARKEERKYCPRWTAALITCVDAR